MTGIYEMTLGITTIRWSCESCAALRIAAKWTAKKIGEVDGKCDDCNFREQVKGSNP
jgi:hypothetical protein